ncbi:vanadium-dependent haloperoxidase [Dyadobacter sp. CY356]|uniref:vanadium-dependent haloperoxidase n=1 Tax=Dyadobacter sp. CY356 TaxID=2906442 RepID=UPI001F34F256|nr:vanadium-dependent haloperoxidase [Dyadobacter sp. CY356]MCF0058127.1 vanadium-dependent haloperoxidase [Dyadobacter sp. CY356]
MKIKFLLPILFIGFLTGCNKANEKSPELNGSVIGQVTSHMTDVMVHDVTNPPLGARFYSYACLAGYEVVAQNDSAYKTMHGVLNDFPEIKKPEGITSYSYQLSAVMAMLETAKKMQPSGNLMLQKFQDHLLDSCKTLGFSDEIIAGSKEYGLGISKQILKYAKADRYNRISNFPRYSPTEGNGNWYPTPPGYFPPVEPYFRTVRPFTLDTSSQFRPAPPVPFSEDKNSEFFKLMVANYQLKVEGDAKVTAAFWDCNPFALENKGHLLVGMKKISPGAHWIGITDIACKQAKTDFSKTLLITTSVSIGLMDGFMACWDEKYRSNRIRPETVIRKYLDPNWKPFLQTPPFPEYLSGHSVVSSASAVILTHYFGDNFAYTDTVEERFGLKARKFKSFKDAAKESGLSRFYGGIHFMDAVENGWIQGDKVGNWVVGKLSAVGVRQSISGKNTAIR